MEEMHEKRGVYVQRVKEAPREALDTRTACCSNLWPSPTSTRPTCNTSTRRKRFDAEGLTRIIEEIEGKKRKVRNDIEQDSMIRIRTRNLGPSGRPSISSATAKRRGSSSQREIEVKRAVQRAEEVARERAARDTEAEQAQILAREAVEKARIANERAISEARIASERDIRQQEIERSQAVEAAEIVAREAIEAGAHRQRAGDLTARIESERETRAARDRAYPRARGGRDRRPRGD